MQNRNHGEDQTHEDYLYEYLIWLMKDTDILLVEGDNLCFDCREELQLGDCINPDCENFLLIQRVEKRQEEVRYCLDDLRIELLGQPRHQWTRAMYISAAVLMAWVFVLVVALELAYFSASERLAQDPTPSTTTMMALP